ncbi:ATP-binding protein [Candidatus Oscillochloris fontis]|uniref:ATP-binding protein n=1 Tax=Candidatus Oscillochloris fontis TaxID=2496868 RepID=UPI00101B66EB|nr:ATP-binding protein [Candidatus Oscillochloris fontis]
MDEVLPFPLLALVGQPELKTALILGLINPQIGGVLISGPYGVGKTTSVRGLLDIMPRREQQWADAEGTTHTSYEPMRLIELPLNARLEDVVGGINERVAIEQQRVILDEGVLALAHRNLLYVDEINLLDPAVVKAILDAAAQGRTLVRRGPMTRLFPSQFFLVGSMNPEEGPLRPQILDRFGLRVWVMPLEDPQARLEAYRRTRLFRTDPSAFRLAYAAQTSALAEEVEAAREILPHVEIPPHLEELAMNLVQTLKVPSQRAEIALLEAARARAAADFRDRVSEEDVRQIAPLALRQRHSLQIDQYVCGNADEYSQINAALDALITPAPTKPQRLRKRSTVRQIEDT